MKTAKIFFKDSRYNYTTRFNGTDEEIKRYFVGQWFNFGTVTDNMQECIGCKILD